jgi:hypothetical protein
MKFMIYIPSAFFQLLDVNRSNLTTRAPPMRFRTWYAFSDSFLLEGLQDFGKEPQPRFNGVIRIPRY